jgi:hypothetical protein
MREQRSRVTPHLYRFIGSGRTNIVFSKSYPVRFNKGLHTPLPIGFESVNRIASTVTFSTK